MEDSEQARRRRQAPREYPVRPIPSCHALVMRRPAGADQPEILLVLRAAEPKEGFWALPGGAIEVGETAEQALVREVQEETGCVVEPGRLLGLMDLISRDYDGKVQFHFIVLHYVADFVAGEPCANTDALDVRWVPLGDLAALPVTGGTYQVLELAGYPRDTIAG